MSASFFELDRVKSVEDIKVGMILYEVLALGSGILYKHEIISEPYNVPLFKNKLSYFVEVNKTHPDGWVCKNEISLDDCGVTDSPYNYHKIFFTKEAAVAYIENVNLLKIGYYRKGDWLDFVD